VAALMGHAKIDTTLNIYTQCSTPQFCYVLPETFTVTHERAA
jgi:hypothetical protein